MKKKHTRTYNSNALGVDFDLVQKSTTLLHTSKNAHHSFQGALMTEANYLDRHDKAYQHDWCMEGKERDFGTSHFWDQLQTNPEGRQGPN